MSGVASGLVASMAVAPAPEPMPKMSGSAFAYVTDCCGARYSGCVTTVPPAPGMNRNCPDAEDLLLGLKSVRSVRHCELPAPPICAAAETRERNALYGATTTVCEVVLVVVAFHTCSVTLYVPATEYVCDAFFDDDVPPSPKYQNHCVGEPADWSVKLTVSPTFGDGGPNANAADVGGVTGIGAVTVTSRLVPELVPLPLTLSETVYDPALAYTCVGFWAEEAKPSPNCQSHAVIGPVD